MGNIPILQILREGRCQAQGHGCGVRSSPGLCYGLPPHTTTWTHPHITGAQVEPEPFKRPVAERGEGVGPKPQARPELHSLGRVSGHLAFSL